MLAGYKESVVFDRSIFPEYIPRKIHDAKSFPVSDAVTHIFFNMHSNEDKPASAEGPLSIGLVNDHELNNRLIRLTSERLRQLVHLLQLPPKQGKKRRGRLDYCKADKSRGAYQHKRRKAKAGGRKPRR